MTAQTLVPERAVINDNQWKFTDSSQIAADLASSQVESAGIKGSDSSKPRESRKRRFTSESLIPIKDTIYEAVEATLKNTSEDVLHVFISDPRFQDTFFNATIHANPEKNIAAVLTELERLYGEQRIWRFIKLYQAAIAAQAMDSAITPALRRVAVNYVTNLISWLILEQAGELASTPELSKKKEMIGLKIEKFENSLFVWTSKTAQAAMNVEQEGCSLATVCAVFFGTIGTLHLIAAAVCAVVMPVLTPALVLMGIAALLIAAWMTRSAFKHANRANAFKIEGMALDKTEQEHDQDPKKMRYPKVLFQMPEQPKEDISTTSALSTLNLRVGA